MEMVIDFPGGARVDAHFEPYTVKTDQPPTGGGDGSAPAPFTLFLASIGTCAGIYVLGFCKQRNLPTDGIRIIQRAHPDPMTGMIGKIELEIQITRPTYDLLCQDFVCETHGSIQVKGKGEMDTWFLVGKR